MLKLFEISSSWVLGVRAEKEYVCFCVFGIYDNMKVETSKMLTLSCTWQEDRQATMMMIFNRAD